MIESLRRWWHVRTGVNDCPLDGDTPAWLISLVVNASVMVALGMMPLDKPTDSAPIALTAVEQVEETIDKQVELPELQPKDFYFSDTPQEKIGANSVGGDEVALALAPVVAEASNVPVPEVETVQSPATSPIQVHNDVLVATGPTFSENRTVRGAAVGIGATGTAGAIDRITHEILRSLEERKTLVVWLFDQSGSLARQRADVIKRFDRIYEELGVIEASGNPAFKKHENKPLLSSIVAFGKDVNLLTPTPTDELAEIKAAVNSIKTDESGIERVFSSVFRCVEKYRSYRTGQAGALRNVMFVVFTDEVGDDADDGLDPTVDACRKFEIPVYVVGVPAPFGRREALIKYVDPDPNFDQTPKWVPVRQGPESFQPEVVNLGFAGTREFEEPMDSGFGPYSLTRLCYETGGIFFTVHPNRKLNHAVGRGETDVLSAQMTYFFDSTIMRNYRPDYVSVKEYNKLLSENKARLALVEASKRSFLAPMQDPRTHFPKRSDGELANELSLAQRAAAVLEPKMNELYELLKLGEKDRPKLTQPRWQAGYDLAMGRVLATKVRTEAYNLMLAKAKQGMKFKNPKDDTWDLRPANEIGTGSAHEKLAALAKEYLDRVVKEHKDTPWAMLAQRELAQPLGWRWDETYTGVMVPRQRPGAGGNAPPPRDDRRVMIKKPPPSRPAPKL